MPLPMPRYLKIYDDSHQLHDMLKHTSHGRQTLSSNKSATQQQVLYLYIDISDISEHLLSGIARFKQQAFSGIKESLHVRSALSATQDTRAASMVSGRMPSDT